MKPRLLQLLVFVLLVGTWGLGEAVEPLKPYDNFQLGPINPNKWLPTQFGIGGADAFNVYEANRTIILDPLNPSERVLRILNRAYGENNSNAGTSFGAFRLKVKNPSTTTAIRARLQVRNFTSTGCPGNSTPTAAQAQILGWFFNAGTPTPGSGVDDVIAGVGARRSSDSADPPGVLQISAFVFHCSDVDCFNGTFLGGVPLGTVTTGQWVRLLMQWDQANHRFIFQRGTQPPLFVPYTVTDTQLPGVQLKTLGVDNFVANCTAAPRPTALVDTLWDNVFVNENAIP